MLEFLLPLALFVFGTLIGSFLNVLIWRLPQEEKITGRSHCPHCAHTLSPHELIPILSYIWQRGRCVGCHAKISPRYWRIELITGLLFALSGLVLMPVSVSGYVELLRMLIIVAVLVVVFVIDLEHYLILDVIVFPASIVLVLLNLVLDLMLGHALFGLSSMAMSGILAAGLAGGFFYFLWFASRGRWMGFGDVKFSLFLGLALGLTSLLMGLFVAFLLGAIIGLGLMFSGKKQLTSKIPFGTFLSLGALLALWYGSQIWQWYLSLLMV